jgi:stage III sporulation protein AF
MNAIMGAWASRLVFLILFATLMEMCLPAGELRRYVKMLLGLVVLVAMLHPLIELVKGETYIDALLLPGLASPWADTPIDQGIAVGEAAINAVAGVLTHDVAKAVEIEVQTLANIEAAQVSIDGRQVYVLARGTPTAQVTDQLRHVVAEYLQILPENVTVCWVTGY